MSADEIDYSLQWNSNDSQLNILGNFKNANRGYTRLVGEEDEDGITHLKIYSSPWNSLQQTGSDACFPPVMNKFSNG